MSTPAFTPPPWHLLAVEYMRVFPGTPYARAVGIVKGESGEDPHAEPWYYSRAMEVMYSKPGMTWDEAVSQVTGGTSAPAAGRAGPNPVLPAGDPPEDDPFAEPPHHKAAVAYMLSRPGTTYESAVGYVRGRR